MPITYWNRQKKKEEQEKVYGDSWVNWLYGTPRGQLVTESFLTGKLFSKAYGAYQSSLLSRRKIEPFIRAFDIPMQEYEPGPFDSFNEFFIRRFRPLLRPFEQQATRMPAPAEARYLAYSEVRPEQVFPVKGQHLSAAALLGDAKKAEEFEGGPLLLARLCPVDYHRFHYPDEGTTLESYSIEGRLHSVNPLALQYKSEIFATNERAVAILDSKNFGRLAYIEVGAMCVGRIVQSHAHPQFKRGQEKGYFLFGGSTVILLGQPGRWKPDPDLLERTAKNTETLVRLGEGVASVTLPS